MKPALALCCLLLTGCATMPDLSSCEARRAYAYGLRATAAAIDCPQEQQSGYAK